jgi:hypothetical protein
VLRRGRPPNAPRDTNGRYLPHDGAFPLEDGPEEPDADDGVVIRPTVQPLILAVNMRELDRFHAIALTMLAHRVGIRLIDPS